MEKQRIWVSIVPCIHVTKSVFIHDCLFSIGQIEYQHLLGIIKQ